MSSAPFITDTTGGQIIEAIDRVSSAILNGAVDSTGTTASGNPLSIPDALPADVKSCVVGIEPIQDLHGYDKPWSGGAGKNKLQVTATTETKNGVTFTVYSDGTVVANGTASAAAVFTLQRFSFVPQNYILNGCPSGGTTNTYELQTYLNGVGYRDFGDGVSIPSTVTATVAVEAVVRAGVTVSNLVFKPMIRLATETDPTFAPYTNICPISGIDSVAVERTGKNLCEKTSVNNTTIARVKAGNTYTFSCAVASGVTVGINWYKNNDSGTNIGNGTPFTFTADEDFDLYLNGYVSSGGGSFATRTSEYQLELGSTATPYEPYQGSTTTIPLGQTVYGGTLDVKSGVLTVDTGYIASYNGQTLPGAWISDRDVYTGSNSPTTGAQVVYELATPTTIQLTSHEISLLKGQNVITVNGNTVIAVEYHPDIVPYVDSKVDDAVDGVDAMISDNVEGDTASKAYAVNDFMIRPDGFYKVTAPIANGAAITSSNTTKTTIGAVLTALLNA